MSVEKEPPYPLKGNWMLVQAAAAGMGTIVGMINKDHGTIMAMIAGLKQYAYTWAIGTFGVGIQPKIYEHFSVKNPQSVKPHILSVVIPSAATVLLTSILHSMKGTPETLESIVPTAILAPVAFTVTHMRNRTRAKLNAAIEKQ